MDVRLQPTPLLDYDHPSIQALIAQRGWRDLPHGIRIGAVYDFVRDEIGFGYNSSDALAASEVLADGYGQCNTKTTLLMTLLRAVDVPCRFHGATIDKSLQKGVLDGILYRLAPRDILHSWAEVRFEDRWVELEGVILDADYLTGLRDTVASGGAFLGFGAGTEDIGDPPVAWTGTDTAIQKTGVNRDLGTYDNPDAFYRKHGTNLSGIRNLLYQRVIRHVMNRRVASLRGCASLPRSEASAPDGS
ncbi:transglutaminase domain-containing protein [Rhodococcus sp. TAF43]|uniref:transglutaminase-like domain-containing protein n=1 Tax=unclassified Rhodococcus (in: high G+C Gram-positive bacteria) TaxID=192944 RepID=UPI001581A269|nr:transglutaminase family protein [Rhodococcus sp. W8901]QKT11857.1 transglutaminase family protein [Rhodococcus sp. W8901]